jgi:hypothetical protein
MDTLVLSKPKAARHRAKQQTKAAESFLRHKRAKAKLDARRRATKVMLLHRKHRRSGEPQTTRNWLDDLAAAIQAARDAGPPKKKSMTQPLWLQGGEHDSISLTSPLRIALIVCDSVLRSYHPDDEDDDDDKPPSFQTVAAAIGRALGVVGRNSLGYVDRRQAKRQREQVGLELLQIAATVGLIKPLKKRGAKPTKKGGKRQPGQRCELSEGAKRDMALIQARLAIADDLRTDQVLFAPPPPVPEITENWRGWEETPECTNPEVIRALALAQNTAWRICEPILDEVLGDKDPVAEVTRAVKALQRAQDTLAAKLKTMKNAQTKVLQRAKSKPRIKAAKDDLRKWLTVVQAVSLRGKTFYFKCRFDYRGRLYQVGSLLGYTGGDDLARALLEFAVGEVLPHAVSATMLSRHITSMFGHGESKKSDLERIGYALHMPKKPRGVPKHPWRYRAAMLAYERYKVGATIHTPVAFDCTSSGLQIYSILMRDEALGRRVNMFADASSAERPLQDIYRVIGDEVREERETIKLLVNPQIYGAGAKRQAKILAAERGHALPTAADKADVRKVRAAVEKLAPAFVTLRDWLKCQAASFSDLGVPFSWTLGDGFKVLQDSRIIKESKAYYCIPGVATQVRYCARDPTEEIDPNKQQMQIAANYIHSFDAYFLREVLRQAGDAGGRSFGLAHDSFAVLPSEGYTLLGVLRKAIWFVYSRDWLMIHAGDWYEQSGTVGGACVTGGPPLHPESLVEGWLAGSVVE